MKNTIVTLCLICMIFMNSCSKTQEREQVLHRVMLSFETLDPQISLNLEVGFVAMHVFSRLVEFGKDGELYPSLLKEFPTTSQDGLTYTFELKPNIKFSNGTELKSSDVKFTFQRMLWPEVKGTKSTWIFDKIKGAKDVKDGKTKELIGFKILNNYKFIIQLDNPYEPFIQGLATPYASIFPEEACKKSGAAWSSSVIGSGPFKVLGKLKKGNELILERNKDYFGVKPKIDKIVNKVVDKSTIDFAETQAEYDVGNLDIISIPIDKYAKYKNTPEYNGCIKFERIFNTQYLTLNNKYGNFKDKKVRQAISLAIDRKKLCKIILDDAAEPAYTIIPKGIDGYDESASIEYNIDKAKQLLKEAGFPKGFTIDYFQRYKTVPGIDYAVQAMLGQIGIKTNMVEVDEEKLWELKQEGRYTMSLSNWSADIPDADNFLNNLFNSELDRLNAYDDQLFNKRCEEARKISDRDRKKEIYRELDRKICQEDWATVPICHNLEILLAKPNVHGVYINPVTSHTIFWEAYLQ